MALQYDGITPSEAEDLIEAFVCFDKDNDGHISLEELGPIMRAMGQNPSREKLIEIMKKADVSGDGVLSEEEYIKLIRDNTVDPNLIKSELREVFKHFDKTQTGDLNLAEMKKALINIGHPLSDSEIKIMMQQADSNGDGKVDINEFVNLLSKKI